MKKYSKIFLLVLIAGAICAGGCQKFLDIKPKGLDIIQTTEQYNGLLNSSFLLSFQNFRVSSSGTFAILGTADNPVYMGDEMVSSVASLNNVTESQQFAFQWKPDIYLPDEEAHDWSAFYSQVYVYNKIVDSVMSSTGGNEQRKKSLRAEALANRAFNFLIAANFYGQPFRASSAATDLSIPLVLKPDATATNFTRATVKDVYDKIVADLLMAIPDLTPNIYSRVRVSRPAAQYMLGQTYFMMGDYVKALAQFNQVKAALASSTVPLALYDYNVTMPNWVNAATPHRGASGYPFQYNSTETIFVKQISFGILLLNKSSLFIKPAVYNLFGATDQRKSMFYNRDFSTGLVKLYYLNAPGDTVFCYMRNSPGTVNWGPSLPNLYLMLAECKARASDLNGAKEELETLRMRRMQASEAQVTITTQEAMVRFVLDERLREYAATGIRWFDVRRLWDDPVYKTHINPIHREDLNEYTLTRDRLTLRIPPMVKSFNPDMPDNP